MLCQSLLWFWGHRLVFFSALKNIHPYCCSSQAVVRAGIVMYSSKRASSVQLKQLTLTNSLYRSGFKINRCSRNVRHCWYYVRAVTGETGRTKATNIHHMRTENGKENQTGLWERQKEDWEDKVMSYPWIQGEWDPEVPRPTEKKNKKQQNNNNKIWKNWKSWELEPDRVQVSNCFVHCS